MRTGYSVLSVLVHLDYHENRRKSSGKILLTRFNFEMLGLKTGLKGEIFSH